MYSENKTCCFQSSQLPLSILQDQMQFIEVNVLGLMSYVCEPVSVHVEAQSGLSHLPTEKLREAAVLRSLIVVRS